MSEIKTCGTCDKMRLHIRENKTIYTCEESQYSTSLIHRRIITPSKWACKYYEEKEKGEYVGSALSGYNKGK